MITAILLVLLSFIIVALALVFSFSLITLILIFMPLLVLIGYLSGGLKVNGKVIKPFYIK